MHIHIPDGILPTWLWMGGYLISIVLLLIDLRKVGKETRRIPLVGMMIATVLIVMSIPIGLPFHMNFMVLTGIVVGTWWSLIVSFVTNLILASFGHGGITIVGLNTLVLWMESLVGTTLFRALLRLKKNYFISSLISTFVALISSALFVIGIVAVSTVNPSEFLHHVSEEHLEISLPTFIRIVIPIAIIAAIIEAVVTGFVINYIYKIRPKLLS